MSSYYPADHPDDLEQDERCAHCGTRLHAPDYDCPRCEREYQRMRAEAADLPPLRVTSWVPAAARGRHTIEQI